MKDQKTKIWLMTILGIAVGLGVLLTGVISYQEGNPLMSAIAIIAGAGSIIWAISYARKSSRDEKKGLPLTDERSNRVVMFAFGKAFVFSIWWLLVLGFLSENTIQFRDVSQATSTAILGMVVIAGLCWLWYRNKDLDKARI
ncbi:hypothetical protein JXB11_03220 [Candidatus Woesearchaeota archaeon]|nr:hypothetical protein [Candidatus Woesearchaeota archaeon]